MSTYSVDGIPLDHPNGLWTLQQGTGRRPFPGARGVEIPLAGRAGEIPVAGDTIEPLETTTLGFTFLVRGRAPWGGAGNEEDLEHNLEALAAVLSPHGRLVDLRHHIGGDMIRQTDAKFISSSEPELLAGANAARVTMLARIPGVYWRDVPELTHTWSAGLLDETARAIPALSGCTAPIPDAVLRVKGPATNPALSDTASGGTVAYTGTISSGQFLLLDCAALTATRVTTDTWSPTGGTDVTGNVDATGPGSAYRWLHLTPRIHAADPLSRLIQVSGTATGTSDASGLAVRARRSFR
ncbi:hypothetical protein Aple_010800 [Acrocarpospora pleiomorpha]|uniref:Tail protein n=1 Tax=Acrocarpospora pleiomorpha TaxID=90975 RepID=A0A5M3X8Z0_9ACTN|nr:hypothetical protein [Acrocarpospora pleiomorpha]GES18185.1 hypothetical protein Aple_010800 [Acrocarpospora pleiomorpha]